MFWKRKTPDTDATGIDLEVDGDEQREHYRVRLPEEMPAQVIIARKAYRVRDLSAGGMAFVDPGFKPGQELAAILLLGPARTQVRVRLTVIPGEGDRLCHARFQGTDEAASEALHRFVLQVQKHQIRVTREMRTIDDADL